MLVSNAIRRCIFSGFIVGTVMTVVSANAIAQYGARSSVGEQEVATAPFTVEPYATYTNAAHVANGASLRNVGQATIRLRGMPSDAHIIHAWLYWDFTSLTAPTPLQSNVFFGKVGTFVNIHLPVSGARIGSGVDPCWYGGSNFVFRADATHLINGNGDYLVSLFLGASSLTNGSNPWGPPIAGPLAEGASLVVVYGSSLEKTGTVVVYDRGLAGTEFESALTYNLDDVPAPSTGASIFTEIGADGQIGAGLVAGISLAPGDTFTGKTTAVNATVIAGPGGSDNDSDWNGSDGVPLNQLWDTHSHDISGLLVTGLNNITVDDPGGDCLVAVASVLTVR
jgi:hypothetical protein